MHRITRALCELLRHYEQTRPDPGFHKLIDEAQIPEEAISALFEDQMDGLSLEEFERIIRHLGLERGFTTAVTPQALLLEHNFEEFSEAWAQKNQPKP